MLTHENIIDFIKDSCALLKSLLSPTEYNWESYTIDRYTSGYRIMSSTRPDFELFLNRLHFKNEIPFLKTFALLLQNDTRYICIKNKIDGEVSLGHWLHPESLLLTLLSDYLKEVTSIEPFPATAEMLSSHFLDSLSSAKTSYFIFSPIKGLSRLPYCIDVESGLQLRCLSDSEICSIMEDYKQDFWAPDFPGSTCIVESEVSVPVWHGVRDISETKRKCNNILNALRILKDTDAILNTIYTRRKHRGAIRFGHGGGWSATPGWQSFSPIHALTIEEDDVSYILKYYRCFTNDNLPSKLSRCLNRYNFALERNLPEDKLVDALIALEALFGDGTGAIGYKIALRASVFLEDEFAARCSINDFINDAYRKRSAIVHGKSSIQVNHIDRLTNIARRSIRKNMDILITDNKIPDSNDFDVLLLK